MAASRSLPDKMLLTMPRFAGRRPLSSSYAVSRALRETLSAGGVFIRDIEERIAAQRRTIEEMEKGDHETKHAAAVLRLLKHSLELHVADRDRLRAELAKLPA
jgi:hypothetical protein